MGSPPLGSLLGAVAQFHRGACDVALVPVDQALAGQPREGRVGGHRVGLEAVALCPVEEEDRLRFRVDGC